MVFKNHSFHYMQRIINYIMDMTYCWIYGITIRLDKKDIKTILVWFIVINIQLFLSFLIHPIIIILFISSAMILSKIDRMNTLHHGITKNNLQLPQVVEYLLDNTLSNNALLSDNQITYNPASHNPISVYVGSWEGRRPHMEDEHFVCIKNNLFGVFDGHGGNDASKYIKNNFSQRFDIIFNELLFDSDSDNDNDDNEYDNNSDEEYDVDYDVDKMTIEALEKTIIELDKEICYNFTDGGAVGMVVKINHDKIYCTYIGDSEAYMVSKNNTIKKITENHSFSTFTEYRRYRDTMDPLIPKKGIVLRTCTGLMPTRTIGDNGHKLKDKGLLIKPESSIQNCKDQFSHEWKMLLLGSDGIWDCVSAYDLVILIDIYISQLQNQGDKNKEKELIAIPGIDDLNILQINMTNLMIRLQEITTKTPNLIDKLTSKYYGDNCTLMVILNKNIF